MKNFIELTEKSTSEKILVNIDYIIEIFSCKDCVAIKQFCLRTRKNYEFLCVKETLGEIKERLKQIY